MDPVHLLLFQWQGLALNFRQIWDLISLPDSEIKDFLAQNLKRLPEKAIDQLKMDQELCLKNSIQLIPFWHPHYPTEFLNMSRPPWVLSCFGDSSQLVQPSIAVVGSRKLSYESRQWMETELSEFIMNSNLIITSGGANGVDHKAHQLSVLHARPSICWLPSGLLNLYPHKLMDLKDEILSTGGVLVSTYHPLQQVRKCHFHERNQFIAANSIMTFVIQAKRKSGTLITAKAAADMSKTVAVLPSSPKAEGLGGLDLLFDGAQLIRSSADLYHITKDLMME